MPKNSSNIPYRHFAELDGMRGILSVVVVFYHWGLDKFIARVSLGYLKGGNWALAVDFFLVLSGFVLCYSLRRRPPTFRSFLIKRIFRLLPVALFSLLIALLLQPFYWGQFRVILVNILLTEIYFGLPSINGVSWSACIELWAPSCFILLLAISNKRPSLSVFLLFFCLVVSAWMLRGLPLGIVQSSRLSRSLFGLLSGFFLFSSLFRFGLSLKPIYLFIANAITLLSLLGSLLIMALSPTFKDLLFLFPITAALSIYSGVFSMTFLSLPLFQFLGKISYSLYMIHFPLLLLVNRFFGSDVVSGNMAIKSGSVGATILVAYIVHKCIEMPFMRIHSIAFPGSK